MADFIPVANPLAQVHAHAEEIQEAIRDVVASGWYILGNSVAAFEKEFADFAGAGYCVGVASGTDALLLGLKAVGIRPGDEVITVSHTAVATVAAIELSGAIPVFADVDPTTRCLDPECLPALISEKTRALIPVHIYGQPAPMEAIMTLANRYRLKVVEDCAQAHGAAIKGKRVGTFGDAGTFSFYPTKNLGALGDGGAVVTNSQAIAQNIKTLREYGWQQRYISSVKGYNSRLDEIQAAVLRVKLRYLESGNRRRRAIASYYRASIKNPNLTLPAPIKDTVHAMHLYVVESERRDALMDHLNKSGIGNAIHYPLPIHRQPAYRSRIRGSDALTRTDRLSGRILSLPIYPELTDLQVENVCAAINEWDPCRRI